MEERHGGTRTRRAPDHLVTNRGTSAGGSLCGAGGLALPPRAEDAGVVEDQGPVDGLVVVAWLLTVCGCPAAAGSSALPDGSRSNTLVGTGVGVTPA